MDIFYVTGRERNYARNDVLLRALHRLGNVDAVGQTEARSILWQSISSIRGIPRLLSKQYDLVFVGFYGHLLMLPVRLFSQSPVLFDAFVSTYDTLCFDRQVFPATSLPGRAAFWLDQTACRLASLVLVDTPLQVLYFCRTFGLEESKVRSLAVGCNEEIFVPQPVAAHPQFIVLYYSTYQPLHGVETVVRAAAALSAEPRIQFRLIGNGPTWPSIRRLADELKAKNTSFIPSMPLKNIADEIAAADICLGGPFGASGKADRVIPGKIYQILAMSRPLIAAETPANKALLTHGQDSILCAPGSDRSLASAVLELYHDASLRSRIAAAGRALYLEKCSEAVITRELQVLIDGLKR